MTKLSDGFFITLEGIDGCGKTTQAALLADYLSAKGYEITRTREPGGTEIGARIRAILLDPASKGLTGAAELLLYSADRAQHTAEVIEPALRAGRVVVCDRYTDATAAYQGYARGLDIHDREELAGISTLGCRPDLTLLLDLPAEAGLGRAIGRNDESGTDKESRFEQEKLEFHERVRQGYLAIASCDSERVKVVDASRSANEVWESVRHIVELAISQRERAGDVIL